METVRKYSAEQISNILSKLDNEEEYGMILRAKGYVCGNDGQWIYFDYVPGESDVRYGSACAIGKFCVIGSHIHEHALEKLFGAEVAEWRYLYTCLQAF